MMICDRCGRNTLGTTMSKFNTDTLCFLCDGDERGAPNYRKACAAEEAAVRGGNYNYPGIGLAVEDWTYLKAKREERTR